MGSTTDSAGNETRDAVHGRDPAAAAGDDGDLAWLDRQDVAVARRRTLRVLLVAQVLGSLGIGAAPSVGVLLAQEVTRSEGWAGIARASATVGAALLALPLGMLAARHGRRRALTAAWGAAAVGAALLVVAASTRSVPVMVVGMMALGAGSAAGLQSRFAATDLALPAHRARAACPSSCGSAPSAPSSGRTWASPAERWRPGSGCRRSPVPSSSARCC